MSVKLNNLLPSVLLPLVLWRCWLGGRKGIRPVKKRVVGYWHGYLSGARCRLAYMAQLMPLPLTVSCFSKIQIGFTFLIPAHPGSPGKGPLNGCLCVCVCQIWWSKLHLLSWLHICNALQQSCSKIGSWSHVYSKITAQYPHCRLCVSDKLSVP